MDQKDLVADIRPYRELAGQIVARAAEDLLITMVFQRDINSKGDLIRKRCDREYKTYKLLLESHQNQKRTRRERIRKRREEIADTERMISETKDLIERHRDRMRRLRIEEDRARRKGERVRPLKNQIRTIGEHIAMHEKSIGKLSDRIAKIEKAIENDRNELRRLKNMEMSAKQYTTYKGQRKRMLTLAQVEERAIIDWMHSDMFHIISDLDPDGIIDGARRATVRGANTRVTNKDLYYFLGEKA